MKFKSINLIIAYLVISLLFVIVFQYVTFHYIHIGYKLKFSLIISLITVLFSAFLLRYLLRYNENKRSEYLNHLSSKNEELFKSNERYNIVAKATSDTVWDWDLKTGEFAFNKGIQGIYGYDSKDVGNTVDWWFAKIHPEDSLNISVNVYSYIEQKVERWEAYYRFMCADGTFKYIYDRGFLVMDEEKNVIRLIGAMQDITKLKEEELRLRLLETVILESKDSVIITEILEEEKGIPNVVYVNPAFTKMTGYKPKEIIGHKPTLFLDKYSVKDDIKKLAEAFKKKEECNFVGLNKTKDGEDYWINFTMIPIINDINKHSHWISIHRDVTVEKEKEIEREQLISELTQNNKDLKQFSYITSHNLRAPLSNLTGLLNLIEDIPIENPELKEIINGFSKSTELLNETISDLVKVIIIKDKTAIEKEEIVIQDIFENIFKQLSYLINLKNPLIKMNFKPAKSIYINKTYLESIFLNLVTNSLKYNDPTRQLQINISSKIENNTTIIKFSDNGIGIDMERNKDKIFGLYQRFHNYSDSKGLGLYLVKSQVETMGGNIQVESQVGEGTTFYITFKNK